MAQPIIQAEDVSKVYRLGTLGSGSVKKDLAEERFKKRERLFRYRYR